MVHEEKRILRRLQFERPARIITQLGEKRTVKSRDFSMKGASFTCPEPLEIGQMLRLTLNVGKPGQSHIMKLYGKVVHQSQQNNQYLMGICFDKKPS